MFEREVNMSGDPLPNARSVTPAKFSLRPRIFEITARTGQKLKSYLFLKCTLDIPCILSQFVRRFSQGDKQIEANNGDDHNSAPVLILSFVSNRAKNEVQIIEGVPIDVTLSMFCNEVTSLGEV